MPSRDEQSLRNTMLKDIEAGVAAQKYRDLTILINAVEALPKQINACKLNAPPVIPAEFRKGKIPSNIYFSPYEFTMLDMAEHLKELRALYEPHVPKDEKGSIDKGN